MVEFRLLGPVEVVACGQTIEVGPPQRCAVLAALAVDVGRQVTIETLIDRVWGDQPPERVRRALHAHVTRIRRMLEQASAVGQTSARLVRRSGGYFLDVEPDRVDLSLFQHLVESARDPGCADTERVALLCRALGLWRGEPLAGLTMQWAVRTRQEWRQQYLDTTLAWARAELRIDNPTAVIGPLTGLVGEHPFLEPLVVVLMHGLYAAGRSPQALELYTITRNRLVEELGIEPGPELRRVHQGILCDDLDPPDPLAAPAAPRTRIAPVVRAPSASPASDVRWSAPSVASDQLLGRSTELTCLLRVVQRVAQGSGGAAFIEGEAGIGKTSLLQAVRAEVVPYGFLVLRGAARELEGDRPFGALAEALELHRNSVDPERAGIGRLLLGETIEAGGEVPKFVEVRFRLIEAIVSLVERLGLEGPVLLVLEDLHWADPSTLLTAHHIGRRLMHLPIVMLATFRPSARSTMLDRVMVDLTEGGSLHLRLGPLDERSVATLVERVAQAPPTASLLAAVAQAAGNPLFVRELVGALKAEGALHIVDGKADANIRVIPYSFRVLVLQQLATLPQATLQILRVAAVLGSSFSLTNLATVLGRPPTDLLDALDQAWQAKILGEIEAGLAFRHELVREAVYLDLPTTVRRALHLQVGWALAAAGALLEQVAPHLVRGASAGDHAAVDWLWRAAKQVGPRAPATAVELFEHALQLTPPEDPQRYAITAELVDVLIWSGRYSEAAARVRELLERDNDARRRTAVRLSVMRAMLIAGRIEDAATEIEAAMRDFAGDEWDRLGLAVDAAAVQVFTGDPAGGWAAAQGALDRAARLGDDWVPHHAYSIICFAAFQAGDVPAAVAAGTRARNLRGPTASTVHRYSLHIFLGTALMHADRLDDADHVLREGQRIAEEAGMAWQPIYYHMQIGLQRFESGRWDDAVAEAEAASLVAEEIMGKSAAFIEAIRAVIAVHRGLVKLAAEHVTRAQRVIAEGHRLGTDSAIWAAALVQEAQGDSQAALMTLENAWQLNLTMGFRSQNVRLARDLVRLALTGGRPELAAAVAQEMETLAGMNPTCSQTGLALLCRGLAETDLDLLRAAVHAYQDSPRLPERAWACLESGVAFAHAGQRDEAIALLTESATGCEGLDAARDIARIETILRGLGVRRGRRGVRRRPSTGWESLTRTELEVIRLTVEGLTNTQIGQRLFISGRTVETHLSHVFTKLNMSSRVQVATEAIRRLGTDG